MPIEAGSDPSSVNLPRSSLNWAPWTVAALLAVALIDTALPLRDLPIDDKFIVAVYSRNLAEGYGWVYNQGEPVNASTSTINPILGAIAGLFGAPIPSALWWISLGAAGIAIALLVMPFGVSRGWFLSWRGLWVAAMIATSPLLAATFGLESALFVLGMVLVGLSVDRERWGWAFFWSGVLCLVRGEGMLVALLLLPLFWWRNRRIPWPDALWGLLPTAPWALFSWWQFGSLVPSTLEMKRLQGASGLFGEDGILTLLRLLLVEHAPVRLAILVGLSAAALVRVRHWRPSTLLLTVFGIVTVIAYDRWQLPAMNYFWYAVPIVLCILWLAGEGAEGIVIWLGVRWGGAVSLVLLTLFFAAPGDVSEWLLERFRPKVVEAELYREVGAWVDEHVPRTDRVAVMEIGQNGWHMRRRLIDLAGLISPEIGREIFVDLNLLGWVEEIEPEWVLMRSINDRMMLNQLLGHAGFMGAYTQRQEFGAENYPQHFLLFERTGSVPEAMDLARRAHAERLQTAGEGELEALRQANLEMGFAQPMLVESIGVDGDTQVAWQGGALDVAHRGEDGFVWLPWIDVPADLVDTVVLRVSIAKETGAAANVVQLQWRGVSDNDPDTPRGGLIEVPVRLGGEHAQEISIGVGTHPAWESMDHLHRIRLDLGGPGTHAAIESVTLR